MAQAGFPTLVQLGSVSSSPQHKFQLFLKWFRHAMLEDFFLITWVEKCDPSYQEGGTG